MNNYSYVCKVLTIKLKTKIMIKQEFKRGDYEAYYPISKLKPAKVNRDTVEKHADNFKAKAKGIRPQVRDKKGRFQKVTDRTWKSLGYVLSRSIRRKGISKRFGYKGSGFITQVKSSMEKKLTSMILEGYKKDLLEQINK